jgi:hypothetical protein
MEDLLTLISLVGGCFSCEHKEHGGNGWCYVFKDRPVGCKAHKPRRLNATDLLEFNALSESGELFNNTIDN